jgi:hypothetical protein
MIHFPEDIPSTYPIPLHYYSCPKTLNIVGCHIGMRITLLSDLSLL